MALLQMMVRQYSSQLPAMSSPRLSYLLTSLVVIVGLFHLGTSFQVKCNKSNDERVCKPNVACVSCFAPTGQYYKCGACYSSDRPYFYDPSRMPAYIQRKDSKCLEASNCNTCPVCRNNSGRPPHYAYLGCDKCSSGDSHANAPGQ